MIRRLLIGVLCCLPAPALACSLDDAERIRSDDGVTLWYRLKAPPLPLAQHFTLQFRACRGEQLLAVEDFELDATMPAHQHGMNYHASVHQLADGLIEARGLLFHMPGHWEVVVEFDHAGAKQRFSLDFQL